MYDHWVIEDSFGRRWRLWLASDGETGGMRGDGARSAIDALVSFSLGGSQGRHDHTAATLLAIHDRLTGGWLSRGDGYPVDLGTARRTAERVSEALGHAAYFGHLRIERATPLHVGFVLEDAPDTMRDVVEAAPESIPAHVADWIGVVIRDEDGAPISNVRCRITAPGRAPVDATSDASGRVLLRSVEIGSCVIELPEVDGREWAAGAAAAS
jgi:hypothetical protein